MMTIKRALAIPVGPRPGPAAADTYATVRRTTCLRTHVWIEARHFFSRADAQQFCWLWLLDGDGRVHALRLDAARCGDDHAAKSLLARFATTPDMPIPSGRMFGPAFPLPGAPVVPLPRWSVSWGHPVQQAIRAFAAELDHRVLAALGKLETPGPFFGSAANYNRLTTLPPTVRAHRLQALEEFPPLAAPLLLDQYARPDMFGTNEDEPVRHACHDNEIAPVLDAIDRGRDLIGALATHHGIGRALVRSKLFREPWGDGGAPRDVLRLLDAIPPQARPRDRASLEDRVPLLCTLPVRMRSPGEVAQLARAFAPGWDAVWQALEASFPAPATALRDTRDFLREALQEAAAMETTAPMRMEGLALAWLARLGPLALLEASRRWHAQPLIVLPVDDGLPEALVALFGTLDCEWGQAVELTTRQALIDEGNAMHHCVGGYWATCVTQPLRVVHLVTRTGATATASYGYEGFEGTPRFGLEELRGPCNDDCDTDAGQLAQRVETLLNSNPLWPLRKQAVADAAQARAARANIPRQRDRRALDRESRNALRKVLAWHARQPAAQPRPEALLRSAIAGFGYAEGMHLRTQLSPDDALQLVREPGNPHDPHAVRIDWNGRKLGYVPRADNLEIARLLDDGMQLAAFVTTVNDGHDPWDPVEFEITMA